MLLEREPFQLCRPCPIRGKHRHSFESAWWTVRPGSSLARVSSPLQCSSAGLMPVIPRKHGTWDTWVSAWQGSTRLAATAVKSGRGDGWQRLSAKETIFTW